MGIFSGVSTSMTVALEKNKKPELPYLKDSKVSRTLTFPPESSQFRLVSQQNGQGASQNMDPKASAYESLKQAMGTGNSIETENDHFKIELSYKSDRPSGIQITLTPKPSIAPPEDLPLSSKSSYLISRFIPDSPKSDSSSSLLVREYNPESKYVGQYINNDQVVKYIADTLVTVAKEKR